MRLTALLAVVAIAGGSLAAEAAEIHASAAAMACCAASDFACGGMSAPDDCCRTIRTRALHLCAATLTVKPALTAPAVPVATLAPASHRLDSPVAPARFARPHDPPHLHACPLLI